MLVCLLVCLIINLCDAIPSCDIRDYGAIGDNKTVNTKSIVTTINTCHDKYGKNNLVQINITNGIYITGSFNITSNTILYLSNHSTLAGSTNPNDYGLCSPYPPPPINGTGKPTYCPLIASYNSTNISIIGNNKLLSIIDGRGSPWWYNYTQNLLKYQRPNLIEFFFCNTINIYNISIINSSGWHVHPLFSNNIIMSDINIFGPRWIGGTDGIDPDSAQNVYINNAIIDVGDDAIAIKSQGNIPSQNIFIENTYILSRNFAIGGNVNGGIQNVSFVNSMVGDNNGSSPWAVKIKTHRGFGGYVTDILFENLTFGNIAPNTWQQSNGGYDIMFDPSYGTSTIPLYPAANVSNIIFRNITGYKDVTAGHLIGLNESIWNNIMFENVVLNNSKNGWKCQFVNVISNGIVEPHFPADCLQ